MLMCLSAIFVVVAGPINCSSDRHAQSIPEAAPMAPTSCRKANAGTVGSEIRRNRINGARRSNLNYRGTPEMRQLLHRSQVFEPLGVRKEGFEPITPPTRWP